MTITFIASLVGVHQRRRARRHPTTIALIALAAVAVQTAGCNHGADVKHIQRTRTPAG